MIGNYGNYANRVLDFIHFRLGGTVTRPQKNRLTQRDEELFKKIGQKKERIEQLLERAELRKAYFEILELSSEGNKYINDTKPWIVIKNDAGRANDIFYNCAVLLKSLAVLFAPYLPTTSQKLWAQLNLNGSPLSPTAWCEIGQDLGKEQQVRKPEILFRKLMDDQIKMYKEVASRGTDLKSYFAP